MIEQAYRQAILPFFEGVVKRRKTFSFWRQLEGSQWWTPLQLQRWQLERLRALLKHCQTQSEFYRQRWQGRGLNPDDIRSLDDLRDWPITSREEMREQAQQIRSSGRRVSAIGKSTGGSSGTPLQLWIDLQANDRRTAAAYRGYGWAGAAPGTRQTHLWGVDLQAASSWSRRKNWWYSRGLYRRDVLNSFELSDASVGRFADRINRYRPSVLVAYTNPLYELAREIERRGLSMHSPRSVIVGAEKIYDYQRQLIEKVFDAPVFETYGSREFTLIGAECERHNGLHVTSELLLVEIVDDEGQPVPAGQEGDIVVTDLFNVAMPFVRYAIGDRGIAETGRCDCGRGLPRLREVTGRKLDLVKTPDGRRVPGEFFPHLIKDYPAIRQFQVVQSHPDQLNVDLVVDPNWTDGDRQTLKQKIHQCVGQRWMTTEIRIVDSIPLTASGKRRVVIGCGESNGGVEPGAAGKRDADARSRRA